MDEESNEGGNLETQKLPTVCEEMIKYASNPRGVMPIVLIKLQDALNLQVLNQRGVFQRVDFMGPKSAQLCLRKQIFQKIQTNYNL